MADGMQALQRQVVNVVIPLARFPGPTDERGVQAVAHFLLLFIEHFLRHFLPLKTQIAHHGDHPQPDRMAGRQMQRAFIAVPILCCQKTVDRAVREITRGDNVRRHHPAQPADTAALGQVRFQKRPMLSTKFTKGVQSFHNARPLRPTAARTGGQRDDTHRAARQ